jgi:wyosine [tRNA(Phe)-imidazoG37] synthetase (radical SAM superfamily)
MERRQDRWRLKKTLEIGNGHAVGHAVVTEEVAFGYPRDFLENKFVYLVISPRARGLAIGINVNPIVQCSLECLYCEVDRAKPADISSFDVDKMVFELCGTFGLARSGRLRRRARYAHLPEDLLQVRHVALSGDGEPTLSNHFVEALTALVELRKDGVLPKFKIVIVTNSTALDQPRVQRGLGLLAGTDEIWAKLDGGTQDYLSRLNSSAISLEKILRNIMLVASKRPVIIQSLFPAIDGAAPPSAEITQYARRLKELKDAGAHIPLVQIYSATRPMARTGCSHLPLKCLSKIALTVRRVAGLRAEVF